MHKMLVIKRNEPEGRKDLSFLKSFVTTDPFSNWIKMNGLLRGHH